MVPLVALVLLTCASPDSGAVGVLRRLDAAFGDTRDLTVNLHVVANIERVSVPPMDVRLFFKQPDKVHLESKGFALVPREGIAMAFGKLSERFTAESCLWDTLNGEEVQKLTLVPRQGRTRLRQAVVLVDPRTGTAGRYQLTTSDGRLVTVDVTWERSGGAWLPSVVRVALPPAVAHTNEAGPPQDDLPPLAQRDNAHAGTVEIRCSGYRLNTGLSDDLFSAESR
jgi:hypothetical protein